VPLDVVVDLGQGMDKVEGLGGMITGGGRVVLVYKKGPEFMWDTIKARGFAVG